MRFAVALIDGGSRVLGVSLIRRGWPVLYKCDERIAPDKPVTECVFEGFGVEERPEVSVWSSWRTPPAGIDHFNLDQKADFAIGTVG